MTLTTTSIPLPSAPSNLKLHIPSVSLFQYAPAAACIPRLPADGVVVVVLLSPDAGEAGGASLSEVGFLGAWWGVEEEEGAVCWIMTLLTMYLWEGRPEGGGDSLMRDWRVLFCVVSVSMA